MVLKEAYRYQNYLQMLIVKAINQLCMEDFITETKQTHNRKKSNPDAEDEIVIVKPKNEVDYSPIQLVDFVVDAIAEKEKLCNAINVAKKEADINSDSSISLNKTKQNFVNVLNSMANRKTKEFTTTGTSYKINGEGNQTTYCYNVDNVTTINYDRNNIRKLAKKIKKEADDISTKLDSLLITTQVDYEPKWEIDDTLDEIVVRK